MIGRLSNTLDSITLSLAMTDDLDFSPSCGLAEGVTSDVIEIRLALPC
jgi:hypothetical protein